MPDESTITSPEVLTQLAPTQRILQILTSRELPLPQYREPDHLYYVYDKMKLYLYQSQYADPFSIVEKMPDQSVLVENMLYIVIETGYMYTYSHNSIVELGHIEINEFGDVDPDQMELLKKSGTIYFMNAEERYLDPQTRTLQLPFQNGTYQLTLSLAKDLMIDNETIIKFNEDTEQFEIMGAEFQPDKWLKDIYKYRGNWNESIITAVEEGSNAIKSKVNVADLSGNAIKVLGQGLYVNALDFADASRYNDMVLAFVNYKNIIDRYVLECTEAIMTITSTISQETIKQRIIAILEEYKPDIDDMFEKYDQFEEEINLIQYYLDHDVPEQIDEAEQSIIDYIDSKDNAWSYFSEDVDPALVLTEDQIEAQGLIVSEFRDIVRTLRAITPPEPEPEPEPEPSPEPEPEPLGAGDEESGDEEDSGGGIDPVPEVPDVDPTPSSDSSEEDEEAEEINNHGYYKSEQEASDLVIKEYNVIVFHDNGGVDPEPDPEDEGETPEDEENL